MNYKSSCKKLEQKIKELELENVRLKQVEMASQETAQITYTMINNAEVMFAYMDSEFNLIKVNRTYAEAYGHDPSFFFRQELL